VRPKQAVLIDRVYRIQMPHDVERSRLEGPTSPVLLSFYGPVWCYVIAE